MFPIAFGFVTALAFNVLAYATYGSAALTDYTWVSMVSWGLVAGGVAVYALTRPMPAWLCRLGSQANALAHARLGLGNTEPLCG
jgi:hypothetical protein